jgi:hypothetical protein
MAPKKQPTDVDNLLSRIDELEKQNKELINRVEALEKDKATNAMDWSKLFNNKATKSVEEIKISQGIIEYELKEKRILSSSVFLIHMMKMLKSEKLMIQILSKSCSMNYQLIQKR